ncbi:MAG: hypothetical protein DCC71_15195 [Proteobacteria bacterium]|nr:MAG: hypothetical protein DCC71_15195 [Pseudomonadota bacterium]
MSVPPTERATFRFAEFEFVAGDLQLRRDGALVPIARKPAQLLSLLLQNRDRVVTREETLAALWPDVRVSDAAFHSVVRDLRRAVRDDARQARLIATARGHGLRFTGSVEVWWDERDGPAQAVGAYVGRHALIARLHAAFESACASHGRVVLLRGIAGIGKTRTAKELAEHARSRGAAVHFGRCWKPGFAPPYRPWVELLTSILSHTGSGHRAHLIRDIETPLARLLPAAGGQPGVHEGEEQYARFEVFDAVATLIERASRAEPVVLLIDDLEDGDAETLELLEFVAARIASARVLLVGNFRAGSVGSGHPLFRTLTRLSRLSHCEDHTLTGLDAGETLEFLQAVGPGEPTAEAAEALHLRTDGNPLLLSLFARSGGPAPGRVPNEHAVPSLVREWIRGRLLELPQECVDVVEGAAVVGRVFDATVVASMLERTLAQVTEALDTAGLQGFVAPVAPPVHRFVHALFQEAIYDGLAPERRTELHRRTGDTLASLRREELTASVARHLVAAIDLVGERAVDAAERAAEVAHRRLAFEEGVRLREMALQSFASLPHPDPTRRCELLIALGRAQLAARRVEDAWETARRALALASETGTPQQFARAALLLSDYVIAESKEPASILEEALARLPVDETRLRVQLCTSLSFLLWYQGMPERRLQLAREARRLAFGLGDPRAEINALLAERHALLGPDHLAERIERATAALALAERHRLATHECSVLSWRAVDLLECGDAVGTQVDADTVGRIVESGRGQRFRPFVKRRAAMRATIAGRFAEAAERIGEAHDLMVRAGDPNTSAYTGVQMGMLLHEQGRRDELAKLLASARWLFAYREHISAVAAAVALIEFEAGSPGPARSLIERTAGHADLLGQDPEAFGTVSWLAEICARLGEAATAARLYEWLTPYGDRVSCFYGLSCRGALARYLGLLARTAGRLDDAERWFAAAVDTNRAIEAHVYRAWSLWNWAETLALRDRCDVARAHALAAEARALADELGIGRLREAMRCSHSALLATPEPMG